MSETIKEQSAVDLYISDMVKYMIIVDRRRAFPDFMDGLKPVQRRLIYDMFKQGATSYNKRVKSSAIVGDTMKLYHAHGDQSLYGTMEPMAVWYKCKYPLIAPKGNWGTVMGDPVAAARYTEAGLSNFCFDCVIGELAESRGVVDWVDNYTRSTKEPEYLPVRLPLLLINGSFGIGVGMRINIPSHNLIEVCEATRRLMKDPKYDVVLAPDHCQPCKIIADPKDIREISHTGKGRYRLRGLVEIGEENGYPMIYIKSLPDNVTTEKVKTQINDMILKNELPMVKDDPDDLSKEYVDIRIRLKKGADPNYVKQILYTKTSVETTVSVDLIGVQGTEPIRVSYKQYLQNFINNRTLTKFRLYCNKLKDAQTRHHKLETYIKVIRSGEIDNVIQLIKKQKYINDAQLIELFIKKFHITDLQASYLINCSVKELSEGYLIKYEKEFKELTQKIKIYEKAVTDDGTIINNEIDQELVEIEKKYGKPRLCQVIKAKDDTNIPKGTFIVAITRKNYLRKIPDNEKLTSIKGDDPKFILKVDNTESILLFDNKGRVFKLPVSKIPITNKSAGVDSRLMCKNLTVDIISVIYEPTIKEIVENKNKSYLTVVTKLNMIKKLDLEDFLNVSVSGLVYTKMKDNDEVTGIDIAPANLDIVIFSDNKALRTSMQNVPLVKRAAIGSKAMNTEKGVEGLSVVYPDAKFIVVVTTKGRINKFNISSLASHQRGRSGIGVIKLSHNDSIKAIYGANDSDRIRIVTSTNVLEVNIGEVKLRSPVAAGDYIPLNGSSIVRCDLIWSIKQ